MIKNINSRGNLTETDYEIKFEKIDVSIISVLIGAFFGIHIVISQIILYQAVEKF